MVDPLVVAAAFHRSAMLAYWAWEPLLQLDYRTNHTNHFHGRLDETRDEKSGGPVFSGHLIHTDSELPQVPRELWQLRYLALTRTREVLTTVGERSLFPISNRWLDDNIIAVSLLNAADCFIFGKGSDEHKSHTRGLTSLLGSGEPTEKLVSLFDTLLYHIWCDVSATFGQKYRSSLGTDTEPNLRTMVNDISRRHLSRLVHQYAEANDSWKSFTTGVLGDNHLIDICEGS